jgi:histidyl-tRNA synthetase
VYDHIYHPLEPNGPSVLIISLSETMINEKFRVCSSLWSMSINVIYKIPPQPADDKLTKECLSLNIKYIVILKPGLYQTDRLRVKNVRKNKEEELTMAGLC